MAETPYAPPAAEVGDPAETVRERPQTVRLAALALWISAGLVFAQTAAQVPEIVAMTRTGAIGVAQLVTAAITAVLTIGLLALVAAKLNAGRGWVRWLFLAVYVLGIGMLALAAVVNPKALLSLPPLTLASETFQFILQTAALVLMFLRPSREWFAERRRS